MATIRYPWETPPENGEMIEIAEGVHWLRLPLPMKLDHVNIYVLDDGDGWTLIDTGMKSRRVQAMWQAVLEGPLRGKPVKRVVATHHHPDHIGFHGWFVEEFGAEYVSTQVAYLTGTYADIGCPGALYARVRLSFTAALGCGRIYWRPGRMNAHSIFLTWCIPFPLALPALKRVT